MNQLIHHVIPTRTHKILIPSQLRKQYDMNLAFFEFEKKKNVYHVHYIFKFQTISHDHFRHNHHNQKSVTCRQQIKCFSTCHRRLQNNDDKMKSLKNAIFDNTDISMTNGNKIHKFSKHRDKTLSNDLINNFDVDEYHKGRKKNLKTNKLNQMDENAKNLLKKVQESITSGKNLEQIIKWKHQLISDHNISLKPHFTNLLFKQLCSRNLSELAIESWIPDYYSSKNDNQIKEILMKNNHTDNVVKFNDILNSFLKVGRINEAIKWKERMQNIISLNCYSYYFLLSHMIPTSLPNSKENSEKDEAYQVKNNISYYLKEMSASRIDLNAHLLSLLLQYYLRFFSIDIAIRNCIDIIHSMGMKSHSIFFVAIHMLCKRYSLLDVTIEFIKTLSNPNVLDVGKPFTNANMIKRGEARETIRNLLYSLSNHVDTITVLFLFLCKEMRSKEAIQILHKISDNIDVRHYGMILDSLFKSLQSKKDLKEQQIMDQCFNFDETKNAVFTLLDDMKSRNININTTIMNMLLNHLMKSGNRKQAQEIFQRMSELKLTPDSFTLSTVLDGMCKEGMHEEAYEFFMRVRNSPIFKSNLIIHSVIIMALCRYHKMEKAMNIFESLKKNCTPDIKIYNNLIYGFAHTKDVKQCERLYKEMREKFGIEPNAFTIRALMYGYYCCEDFENVIRIYNELKKFIDISFDTILKNKGNKVLQGIKFLYENSMKKT